MHNVLFAEVTQLSKPTYFVSLGLDFMNESETAQLCSS